GRIFGHQGEGHVGISGGRDGRDHPLLEGEQQARVGESGRRRGRQQALRGGDRGGRNREDARRAIGGGFRAGGRAGVGGQAAASLAGATAGDQHEGDEH